MTAIAMEQTYKGSDDGFGVYIHWPFCVSKCPYCDFNSHVQNEVDYAIWQKSLLAELSYYAELRPNRKVVSIFFGGGTPSLMPPNLVEAIINHIHSLWDVGEDVEITLEGNPNSVDVNKFIDFKNAGINRVSLGVQSLDDAQLKFLGRTHCADEAIKAIDIVRQNFDRYSFDLIYARPEQTLQQWEDELRHALTYIDGHMSLYQLTIEKGTAFYTQHNRGDFSIPDDDLGGALYELTQDIMGDMGLPAYEVSNHARQGQESQHNLVYWRYGDYIGVGPGAHGRFMLKGQKIATRAHRAPQIWLDRVAKNGCGSHAFEDVTQQQQAEEICMMGLRLNEELSFDRLEKQTNIKANQVIDFDKLETLEKEGFVISAKNGFTVTNSGRQRLNLLLNFLLIR